jgi:hypothetical protein
MRYMLNISDEEKQALLNQHSKPYDGYQTLRFPEPDNRIHTYDPAGDKGGITVNNRGEVKSYTNVGINESMNSDVAEPHYGSFDYVENEMCECGGMYNEGVCNECGGSYMTEDIVEPYSELDFSNYDFDSKGPKQFEDDDVYSLDDKNDMSLDLSDDGKEMYRNEKDPYEFDSPGAFGATNTFEGVENPEKVKDSIKESLNWFKRFSNFN